MLGQPWLFQFLGLDSTKGKKKGMEPRIFHRIAKREPHLLLRRRRRCLRFLRPLFLPPDLPRRQRLLSSRWRRRRRPFPGSIRRGPLRPQNILGNLLSFDFRELRQPVNVVHVLLLTVDVVAEFIAVILPVFHRLGEPVGHADVEEFLELEHARHETRYGRTVVVRRPQRAGELEVEVAQAPEDGHGDGRFWTDVVHERWCDVRVRLWHCLSPPDQKKEEKKRQ